MLSSLILKGALFLKEKTAGIQRLQGEKPIDPMPHSWNPCESYSKPGINMVYPETTKEVRRRISAATYNKVWDSPLTFISRIESVLSTWLMCYAYSFTARIKRKQTPVHFPPIDCPSTAPQKKEKKKTKETTKTKHRLPLEFDFDPGPRGAPYASAPPPTSPSEVL